MNKNTEMQTKILHKPAIIKYVKLISLYRPMSLLLTFWGSNSTILINFFC